MKYAELARGVDQVQVVDVRNEQEWRVGHLEGSRNIPLELLADRLHEFETEVPIVAVCRTGVRSENARRIFEQAGLDAHSLDGGLEAWAESGGALIDSEGSPGRVAESQPTVDDRPEGFAELEMNLIEVAFALQERYGNRQPTDAEVQEFMRDWLAKKGVAEAEIERILQD